MATKKNSTTLATAWRNLREQGVLVELPSGATVRLRPVSLENMFVNGQIPDALTSIMASILSSGQVDVQDPVAAARDIIAVKNVVCKSAMMSPKITETPDYENDEISYEDLSSEDSEFIMAWAQRPQNNLSKFRTE